MKTAVRIIDKIVRISPTEAMIIYTHRPPVTLKADSIDDMIQWFFNINVVISYEEHVRSTEMSGDTQIIKLEAS